MRFIYLGGTEFDGTAMPSSVTAFGVRFIETVPTDVLPGDFKDASAFKHAVGKLKTHPHFQYVDDSEGAVEVLGAPKRGRGRPARVVEDATVVEDAAE